MKTISENSTHGLSVEKYTKIFIVRVEIFSESCSNFKSFILNWWYDYCERFSTSFEAREIPKKLKMNFIEPSRICSFFIPIESDSIEAILFICYGFSEYIWTRCYIIFSFYGTILDGIYTS